MITILAAGLALRTQNLDVTEVQRKLTAKIAAANGLTYEFSSYNLKGKEKKSFMSGKVRAMRPNLIWGETEEQCWFSNGKTSIEFYPQDKQYVYRPVDPEGAWLPMGSGLLSFCAPKIYNAVFKRASNVTFNGKKAICIERDEPEVPGLVAKVFVDPATWLPLGWEQTTADTSLITTYKNVDIETIHSPESFNWTPPKDAVDMAKVKRVSTLLKPGSMAPLLKFKDPTGKPVSMKSMLSAKKGLLINFFYYGCGYCQKEFPHLQNLYNSTKDSGLAVLTINKGDDTIPQIKAFLKAAKLTVPCAVNGGEAVKLYGVQGYPTNYLIRPDGKVAYSSSGFGEESFRRLVDEVAKLGISTKNYHVLK